MLGAQAAILPVNERTIMANDITTTTPLPHLDRDNKRAIIAFRTSKASGGGLYAAASVYFQDGQFITFEIFGDFRVNVKRAPELRATAKNIANLHAEAFNAGAQAALIEQANAFYANKAQSDANRARVAA